MAARGEWEEADGGREESLLRLLDERLEPSLVGVRLGWDEVEVSESSKAEWINGSFRKLREIFSSTRRESRWESQLSFWFDIIRVSNTQERN